MGYCTREDLEFIFGETNIRLWLDPNNNNDGLAMQRRLEYAIDQASAYVDARFRPTRYGYMLPFVDVPKLVVRMAAIQTAIYLNDNRSFTDSSEDNMAVYKEELHGYWHALTLGTLELADSPSNKVVFPTVVDTITMPRIPVHFHRLGLKPTRKPNSASDDRF